jgi:hypothetical protein
MKGWLKKRRGKVAFAVLAAAVLAGAFWYGGDAPGLQGWSAQTPAVSRTETAAASSSCAASGSRPDASGGSTAQAKTPQNAASSAETGDSAANSSRREQMPGGAAASRPGGTGSGMSADEKLAAAAAFAGNGGSSPDVEAGDPSYSKSQGMEIDPSTGKDRYRTDPVPEGRPVPVEPQDVAVTDTEDSCTLSISCAAIADNPDWLDVDKAELVPEDGWILKPTAVTFYEGESVFNVLLRTCKQQGIHMEFENTPVYNSAYIEGIGNLYEFDCGELSGWMYKVNGWFPNYGCSRYQLHDGDVVEWVYTCDLGVDVGGYSSAAG